MWSARVHLSIRHLKKNTEKEKKRNEKNRRQQGAVGFAGCRFTASFHCISKIANHICSRCWTEKKLNNFFLSFVCLFICFVLNFVCEWKRMSKWMSEHAFSSLFILLALFCRFLFSMCVCVHELGNHVFGTLILAFAIGIYASLYVCIICSWQRTKIAYFGFGIFRIHIIHIFLFVVYENALQRTAHP